MTAENGPSSWGRFYFATQADERNLMREDEGFDILQNCV
jgi:hypothetical protein